MCVDNHGNEFVKKTEMFVMVGHVVLLFSFNWTNAGICLVSLLRDFLIGYLFNSISDILVYFSYNTHIYFFRRRIGPKMTLQPKSPRVGRSPKLKAKWLSNTLAYQYGNNGTKKSEIIVLSNDLDQYLQVKSHYPLFTYMYQKVSEC